MSIIDNMVKESKTQFEKRKSDHIEYSLLDRNEALGKSGLSSFELIHDALPDLDFSEVDISTQILNEKTSPFFISSMTAGHAGSVNINLRLAKVSAKKGWFMGVGSQRKELFDDTAASEWANILKQAPDVRLIGNIGISQLIHTPIESVQKLVDSLNGKALFVHLNALQECMQPEGTPYFKGGLSAIEALCKKLSVPVIIKETGCGFSKATLERLKSTGVYAVDMSGYGGTHWGRIEGCRSEDHEYLASVSETFKEWGISTVESLQNAQSIKPDYKLWASGGVRTGLDAAKLLALGAEAVGFAKPMLKAALVSEEALEVVMQQLEYELKTALFCTNSRNIDELKNKKVLLCRDN